MQKDSVYRMYENQSDSGSDECQSDHAERVHLNQRKKKLWNTLSKSVQGRHVVDHMFEKHYLSDDSEDSQQLVSNNYVKEEDLIKDEETNLN